MYSIGQTADMAGFSIDTIRYYEKIGLTKPAARGPGGMRTYSEDDVQRLSTLHCLKQTGLSLEDMKVFLDEGRCFANPVFPLCVEDKEALSSRTMILSNHLARMEEQRLALTAIIEQTRQKLDHYQAIMAKEEAAL